MGEPPPAVYWYSEPFFKLNVGVALAGIGEDRDAASLLREGLAGLPAAQRGAEWVREYEEALVRRASGPELSIDEADLSSSPPTDSADESGQSGQLATASASKTRRRRLDSEV